MKKTLLPFALSLSIVSLVVGCDQPPRKEQIIAKENSELGYNSAADVCVVKSGSYKFMSVEYGDVENSSAWCKVFNGEEAITVQEFAKRNHPNALEENKHYNFKHHRLYGPVEVTLEDAEAALKSAKEPKSYTEKAVAAFETPEMRANVKSAETGKQCEVNFDGSVWCPE